MRTKQAQAAKPPAFAQRSSLKCCRFENSALTHSILIFEKNDADEKSLIFMSKIDIWSEPARPWLVLGKKRFFSMSIFFSIKNVLNVFFRFFSFFFLKWLFFPPQDSYHSRRALKVWKMKHKPTTMHIFVSGNISHNQRSTVYV